MTEDSVGSTIYDGSENNLPFKKRCELAIMAGIGGMIPTICKLASTYVTAPETPMPEIGLYFGLALFFLIGSVLCLAFEERTLRQAFIIGLCAPGIITNIAAGIEAANKERTKKAEKTFFSPKSAYAQDSESLPTIKLTFTTEPLYYERYISCKIYIRVKGSENNIIYQNIITNQEGIENNPISINIADNLMEKAKTIQLVFRGLENDIEKSWEWKVSDNSKVTIRVRFIIEKDFLRDLRWSFGYKRKVDRYDVDANASISPNGSIILPLPSNNLRLKMAP